MATAAPRTKLSGEGAVPQWIWCRKNGCRALASTTRKMPPTTTSTISVARSSTAKTTLSVAASSTPTKFSPINNRITTTAPMITAAWCSKMGKKTAR